jgi:uncharacterized coiled-coil protein SlyX
MSSIGEINSRLTKLEKRVTRQAIDIVALNNKVFDRSGNLGNILYTTGILVEDFSNYDAALVASPFFTATINTVKKECRPSFSAERHKLFFIADPDVNYKDDLITMNYSQQSFINQSIPTGYAKNNPSGTLQSAGTVSVFPITTQTTLETDEGPIVVGVDYYSAGGEGNAGGARTMNLQRSGGGKANENFNTVLR